MCSIAYGPVGSNCSVLFEKSQTTGTNSTVIINLPLENKALKYCFTVTASNGTFQAKVEETFKTGRV